MNSKLFLESSYNSIAMESEKEMNFLYKRKLQEIDALKKEFNKNKGNSKKQVSILKSEIESLKELKIEISKMDRSKFEKACNMIQAGLAVSMITVPGLITGVKTESFLVGAATNAAVLAAICKIGSKMMFKSYKDVDEKKRKYEKHEILREIDYRIEYYTHMIKILSDPKYSKYLDKNGMNYDDLDTAVDKSITDDMRAGLKKMEKNIKPFISDLNKEMQKFMKDKYNKSIPNFSKYECDSKEDGEYTIRSTSQTEKIFDNSQTDPDTLAEIDLFFNETIEKLYEKYKFKQIGFVIEEQPDDCFVTYLRSKLGERELYCH